MLAKVIDAAISHLLDVQIRLGLLDDPSLLPPAWRNLNASDIDTPAHR
jgi:hypothetical protein